MGYIAPTLFSKQARGVEMALDVEVTSDLLDNCVVAPEAVDLGIQIMTLTHCFVS
jgi:hypothetical protein